MFKVKSFMSEDSYYVYEGKTYLHSDGSVLRTAEYWPTKEAAQAVLDKFYPKPEHVWEHGDVFRSTSGAIMMYHKFWGTREPEAMCVMAGCNGPSSCLTATMTGAKFLFNIKEKI